MPAIVQDLRYGFRMLRNNPGFTIGAVLSLSLAIGANTAIFNLIDSILLKPLPVKEPSQLVALYTFDKQSASYRSTSYSDYIDYRDQNRVFSGLAAYARIPVNLNNHDFTERISGEIVTSNYFSVLGIEATAGRTFLPHEESLPGGSPVALIGYDLWQRRFSGDPQLVGQTITLNRYPFTVIGIMPHEVKGTVPVAFIVEREKKATTGEEIKQFFLQHGAPYAHPRRVYFFDTLPLGGTGKIDRSALKRIARERME